MTRGSRGARLLVVEADAKHLRTLTRTLRASVGEVDGHERLLELPADGEYDLLVVNYDTLTEVERHGLFDRFGTGKSTTRLMIFSEGQRREGFVQLLGGHAMTNLVAKNNAIVDPADLIVTARKILDNNIFGIEKYFVWGVRPVEIRIRDTQDKSKVVEAAEEFATNLGLNQRFVSTFCAVADELVTNALYNAPVDPDGRPRYAHVSRTEAVSLAPHEEVCVKFCCDGRRLGISAADPFGSLSLDVLLGYLSRCLRKGEDQVDTKEGGAGLGLYYIFESLSHFVVNLHPGKMTEMVGLIDITGSYRDFASHSKSFNVFMVKDES